MNDRHPIVVRASHLAIGFVVALAFLDAPSLSAAGTGRSTRVGSPRSAHFAAGPDAPAPPGMRLVAAAPLTTTTPTAVPTRMQPPTPPAVPTLDPTPQGSPIAVGAPLPTPALAVDAITRGNAFEVREVARFTPPTEGTEVLIAFSPDGHVFYTVSGFVLVARAMPDGAILWSRDMGYRSYWPVLAVSPDGRLLASMDYYSLVLLDAANGEPKRRHASHSDLGGLTFTRDGRRLAELSHNAYTAAWDVAMGDLLADRQVATASSVSPRLRPGFAEVSAVPPWPATNLSLWDIPTGAARWTSALVPLPPDARATDRSAWSNDGRYVAWEAFGKGESGGWRSWICRSDLASAPTCAPMAVHGGWGDIGWRLAVSGDGRVAVGGERNGHPLVCERLGVEVSDGRGTARTVFDAPLRTVDQIEWSPDGALLAVSHRACIEGTDARTTLIAVDPGIAVATLAGAQMPRFAPDGAGLFATDGGALRLYRVRPGSGRSRRVFLPVTWVGR